VSTEVGVDYSELGAQRWHLLAPHLTGAQKAVAEDDGWPRPAVLEEDLKALVVDDRHWYLRSAGAGERGAASPSEVLA
jgi:hypothetical protein